MILLIDNYDSFTYNLFQYIGILGYKCRVVRNNKIDCQTIKDTKPDKIVISPGPGHPTSSNLCLDVIDKFASNIPILGICLGHQAIGIVDQSPIVVSSLPMHGKTSRVYHNNDPLFNNIPSPFTATRYHSLIIDQLHSESKLSIIAYTEDKSIMACKHNYYHGLYGIQFHPESILTDYGMQILQNFLNL